MTAHAAAAATSIAFARMVALRITIIMCDAFSVSGVATSMILIALLAAFAMHMMLTFRKNFRGHIQVRGAAGNHQRGDTRRR